MHHSERAFRAHEKGQQVRRRAGLTGSCCRGAGHDEGEKDGSKGHKAFQGRIFLRDCCRFSPGTAYIVLNWGGRTYEVGGYDRSAYYFIRYS